VTQDGCVLAANDSQVIKWTESFRNPAKGVPEAFLSPHHPVGWVET
jgi:hypothetical protein